MAEFDEKLNQILSDPGAMAQIMQLAQSLGGDASAPPSPPPASSKQSSGDNGASLLSSLAGGIDPAMLTKLLPLVRELGGKQDSNARALLYALRPYLKEERQEKVERALQLARLFHLGKTLLAQWEG
ncbi:hypothetical protein [uncultured Oscillibacter sp.]|jgi:hypothetical protein|uniref:hypothetical protein n=1 Tax=Dysosmobacter sp. TaxID=2591382 RepID=UPI00280A6A73|nr:hypothetical protein [uncultured Oscillibacter sp.]